METPPENRAPDPREDISLAHTPECAAHHFAPWMIEEQWFRAAVEAVRSGMLQPRQMEDEEGAVQPPPLYTVHDGVAVVPIVGAMMKAKGKYAQTSSVDARRAIRKATHDDNVHSILLHVDSPGGSVAGTADLAADVKAADAVKPVYAHIDDLGASAAYWVASQTRRITANATGRVGSIGTLLVLEDTSGAYAAKGIKVHVISTGKYKGAGADGAPITDDQLAMFREGVNDLNEHFLKGVAKGRNLSIGTVRDIADGRVHIADKAKGMRLIDEVASLDQAVTYILKDERDRLAAAVPSPAREEVREIAIDTAEQVPSAAVVDLPATQTNETSNSVPGASPLGESTPNTFLETPIMADQNPSPIAPAQTPAAGSQASPQGSTPTSEVANFNQQAIQGYITQGRQMGRLEGVQAEHERMRALLSASGSRHDLAIQAFLANQDAATVGMIAKAQLDAEAKANQAVMALQVENARLQALNATGGHPGVYMGTAQTETASFAGLEPEAQAKMEWDSDAMIRARHSNNEKSYVLYRSNQLKGNVRVLSKTA